ncbi:hypothetical protein J6590_055807 [Homalodisca vitripennis]|nr:hypothetical protein J6590_055807 [Homalodisca vitripennis]
MAMGSPMSPIFANIFMEEFERKALDSAQFKPKIWWRWQVFEHSRYMLFISEVVPASGLVLMDVPALNQFTFESAVQGDVENIDAG